MTAPRYLEGLTVWAGPGRVLPPFEVDAVVIEQDCDRVLEVRDEPVFEQPGETLDAIVQAIDATPTPRPGTVQIEGRTQPIRMSALVHDFSATPSLEEAWIVSALDTIWRQIGVRRLAALGLPLLGAVHGAIGDERALELIEQSLWRGRPASLERLWLLMPAGKAAALAERWRAHGCTVNFGGQA